MVEQVLPGQVLTEPNGHLISLPFPARYWLFLSNKLKRSSQAEHDRRPAVSQGVVPARIHYVLCDTGCVGNEKAMKT